MSTLQLNKETFTVTIPEVDFDFNLEITGRIYFDDISIDSYKLTTENDSEFEFISGDDFWKAYDAWLTSLIDYQEYMEHCNNN